MTLESEQTMFNQEPTLHKVQEDDESETSMSGGQFGIEESNSESSMIAKKENRRVRYSKILVLSVIVSVATGMGIITHAFVKEKQNSAYVSHVRPSCINTSSSLFFLRLTLPLSWLKFILVVS